MPKASIGASSASSRSTSCSSSPPLTRMRTSGNPAWSRIRRTSRLSVSRSPLSSRTPVEPLPGRGQLPRHRHGIPGSLDRVVAVDQENRRVGERAGIGPECLQLVGEGGDERVGHGPRQRDAPGLAREDVAGGFAPGDPGAARGLEPGVDAVAAPEPELRDRAAPRRDGPPAPPCSRGRSGDGRC